jgi:hypothetical protein
MTQLRLGCREMTSRFARSRRVNYLDFERSEKSFPSYRKQHVIPHREAEGTYREAEGTLLAKRKEP